MRCAWKIPSECFLSVAMCILLWLMPDVDTVPAHSHSGWCTTIRMAYLVLCRKWYRFTFARKHIIQFKIIFFIWGDWNCYVAHISAHIRLKKEMWRCFAQWRRRRWRLWLPLMPYPFALLLISLYFLCVCSLPLLSVVVVLGICTLCACKHYSQLDCVCVLLFAHWLWVWCLHSSTLSPFAAVSGWASMEVRSIGHKRWCFDVKHLPLQRI